MVNWGSWRAHADVVVEQFGQWIGLCDGDGVPLFDLPPASSLSATATRQDLGEVQVTVPLAPDHPLVSYLVDKLQIDEQGGLIPVTGEEFMLVVARKGTRKGYIVSHMSLPADADNAPSQLTIYGADVVSILSLWPCMSHWGSWVDSKFTTLNKDMGATYDTPRQIAAVEMATTADGYTEGRLRRGGAEKVIKELIQQSLDVGYGLLGVDPALVVDWVESGVTTDEVLIQVVDEPVWDTIAEPALNSGLTVTASLWWPGDDPIVAKSGTVSPSLPVGVIHVDPAERS